MSNPPFNLPSAPVPGVASRSALVDYYASELDSVLHGTYQGDQTAYKGMTWGNLYKKLAAQPQYANTDPKELANAVAGIYAAQRVAGNVGAVTGQTGNFIIDTGKAANSIHGFSNPLSWLSSLDAFYRQLTKASMWRSLGWIVLGVLLLAAGVFWWAKTEGIQQIRKVATGNISRPDAPVIPLALMGAGIYLMWFGVKYWEDTSVVWPSDPVKSALTKGSLPAHTADASASGILSAAEGSQQSSGSSSRSSSSSGSSGGGTSAEKQYAFSQFSRYGWSSSEQSALVNLWNQESGWNPKATNPQSGAFGIPQALPASKMASAGSDWQTNWKTQINWGLNYIKLRYGSPSAAWEHEQQFNWY